MAQILANGDEFEHLIGDYDPPAGNPAFREAVAALLRDTYGWPVSAAEHRPDQRQPDRLLLPV